jgi:hypothetical protein
MEMTSPDTQRVDVARLAELLAQIHRGLHLAEWSEAATEIVAALPALLLQAAEMEAERDAWKYGDDARCDWLRARAEAAERAREECVQALRAADEWIANAPHGDNCFVSNHYEGDPGSRCNCGRESVLNYIMETRNNVDAAFTAANGTSHDEGGV